MRHAIFIYGPSGSGKTTIAGRLSEEYGYRHVNTDDFRFLISEKRSRERSQIASALSYTYAKELSDRGKDMVVEALHEPERQRLSRRLKRLGYEIAEVSLVASVKTCLENNRKRERPFTEIAVREAHKHYSFRRGLVLDIDELGLEEAYRRAVRSAVEKKGKRAQPR